MHGQRGLDLARDQENPESSGGHPERPQSNYQGRESAESRKVVNDRTPKGGGFSHKEFMSLALGDVNAASLKALVAQGGAELDDFVAKINAAGVALEDHAEVDLDQVVTTAITGLKAIVDPVNANLTQAVVVLAQLLAMFTQIKDQGLDVGGMKIQLQPPKVGA